jgi:hypothetical protein
MVGSGYGIGAAPEPALGAAAMASEGRIGPPVDSGYFVRRVVGAG